MPTTTTNNGSSGTPPAATAEAGVVPSSPTRQSRGMNGHPTKSRSSSASRQRQQNPRQHGAAARGRRRPTNYTSSYTPPADLVAHAAKARAVQNANEGANGGESSGISGSVSSSRKKCSSLDRSEVDGDERRSHLKRGESRAAASSDRSGKGELAVGGDNQQRLSIEQAQLQQMQNQLRQEQLQNRKKREQQKQRHSMHEQEMYRPPNNAQKYQHQQQQRHSMHEQQQQQFPHTQQKFEQQQRNSRDRQTRQGVNGGSNRSGTSGASARGSRRTSQEHVAAPVAPSRTPSSSSSSRKQQGSSSRRSKRGDGVSSPREGGSSRHSRNSSSRRNDDRDREEMTEQQRIEEYAGKRALLRLEQELADHSESHASNAANDDGGAAFKSVMDRKKLARVPQVKKGDLIIGQYLGRGNFCDVFEVTWTLPEQRNGGLRGGGLTTWSSNRTINTHSTNGTVDDSSDGEMEASMDSLALSCSNDLSLIGGNNNDGMVKSGSRRSVSQIRTSTGEGRRWAAATENFGRPSTLRNPNVLALKCLRPAVRAQPRKFVIGAEDLAHETALLACLDHPNIIQLYGRAAGCFSTAFQMRSKNSSSQRQEGKQMSNEGYFIILDRLMTTLTDRIDEWKSECRAINGVAPPDGTPVQMPPESTLREHLCKRLKVAYCIADALEYLHSRHCVFRDLKPANVGFDCNDCVKMFDFGFATSIAPLLNQPYEGYGPLTETCGTRRYMAPEVALKLGYGKEVDVYSFGMLLWEICALDKPFDSIQSVDEFHDLVVLCGRRPSLNIDPLWTTSLKNLMCRCWSTDPLDRPTMCEVKSLLCNVLRDMNKAMETSRQRRSGDGGGGNTGNANDGKGGSTAQRQEQGGNFIHKWRRRVSI